MAEAVNQKTIERRGLMVVISSPSGAGKSTISRNLLESDRNLSLSVSVTTRAKRGSEIEGIHYHFKSKRDFELMRDGDALLEWAEVHGNFYGTPRQEVEKAMAEGRDMLFDIDWQGAQQLQDKMRGDVVSIFILPPRSPNSAPACTVAPRTQKRLSPRVSPTPRPRSSTGTSTIMWWSTTTLSGRLDP